MGKSAEERYEIAEKVMDIMYDVPALMSDAGIYGQTEALAVASLLIKVTDTMSVLDPERCTAYMAAFTERVKADTGLSDESLDAAYDEAVEALGLGKVNTYEVDQTSKNGPIYKRNVQTDDEYPTGLYL